MCISYKPLYCALVLCITAVASIYAAPSASARELPKKSFVYKADSRKLPDVIQDFAAALEIPVIVAEGVDGTVNGKFNLTPQSFLDLMSSAYSLTWYFDGNVLYVYPARTNQSKVIFLRDFGADRIERLLQTLKVGDKRFPLRYDQKEKTLLVTGPPRHIELVTSLVDALSEGGREEGRRIVRVFPLKYASAGDQTIGGTLATGMVSLLNRMYGNPVDRDGNHLVPASTPLTPMQSVYGAGTGEAATSKFNERTDRNINALASTFSLGSTNPPENSNNRFAVQQTAPVDEEKKPFFGADDANNSVIVMGLPARMATYADLIRQLDVATDLIELEATIIDVSHDDALSFGVDWSAGNRTSSVGYAAAPGLADLTPGIFQITTLSADLSKKLLLSVNALQRQGRARIVARPRVVGVANRTASMKDTRTASVKVAGNLSSNLYSIETGTQIEVIPRRIKIDGVPAIKLALSIQDGSFDTAVVDSVPIVKRTGIVTEAYVGEGDGLLIGGISSQSDQTSNNGLPGLSRIPIIGNIFRSTDDRTSRRERLFLITPRIVSLTRRTVKPNSPDTSMLETEPEYKMASSLIEIKNSALKHRK